MIELKNVSKSYANVNVLNNINLILPNKGLFSILGKSGSGKSTLLNLIGLLDIPTSGDIFIEGVDIKKINKDAYHSNYVSFIFQNYNLIENLKVIDNIEIKENIDKKIYNKLGISNLLNKKVNKLSGGEKQRVAIARAMQSDSKIILADEPTGALDTKNSKFVMQLLKDLSKNKLVIMVTHNEEYAKKYSDYIIKLEDGKIVNKYKLINKKNDDLKIKKHKIKYKSLYKIIKNNMFSKFKRNILAIIAFSIGLISLLLVLSLKNGFNKSIDYENKNSLSKYPIYISKTSYDIDAELKKLNENTYSNNKIISYEENHINDITLNYVNNLNNINKYLDYKLLYYTEEISYYKFDTSFIKSLKIIKGNIPNDNEILLIINDKNIIDKNILKSIGLNQNEYKYESLIGYKYKKYKISGIATFNVEMPIKDTYGLFLNTKNNKIPDEIYLYPKDYKSKIEIKKYLNKYKNIYYSDYATSANNLSKTIVNSISIILIFFSILSLIVSTIMISIITYINIIEKKKEIGILKSLGFSNKNIKDIFGTENNVITLIAALISIIFVLIISLPINNILYKLTSLKNVMLINYDIIITVIELALFLSFIGSYMPIRRINKKNIVDILRNE